MKSTVDSREPLEIKRSFLRAGWQENALDAGDFCFYDSVDEVVLVERKTVHQLLTDMVTGQLQRQARVLTEATQFPILLVEGHWSQNNNYLPDGKHTWCQAWNMLQSLQDIGLRLQLTSSVTHTIQRIFELEEYYAKAFHSSVARHPSGDARISILSHVHGIDKHVGTKLLEEFSSLEKVATASVEDLMQVDGVGPKLARRIYDLWR